VHELSGDVLWRFSAGEPLSQQPVVVEDAVYVVSDPGNLYRVSVVNGLEKWSTPRVKGILAASKERLYCSGDAGKLLVIDMKAGTRIASIEGLALDMRFVNAETDRIIVGTSTGLIQCLHETGLKYPIVHTGQVVDEQDKPKVVQKGLKPGEEGADPMPPAEADPFGGPKKVEDDPFGGGKPAAPKATDDPFGGPAPAPKPKAPATDDPFGP
jgi:hypothetical protein